MIALIGNTVSRAGGAKFASDFGLTAPTPSCPAIQLPRIQTRLGHHHIHHIYVYDRYTISDLRVTACALCLLPTHLYRIAVLEPAHCRTVRAW